MDTAAFIVTLFVILAVGFWYLENEMKQSDGAHGLFAVRQADAKRKHRVKGLTHTGAPRYRVRGAAGKDAAPAPDSSSSSATAKYHRKERAWDRAAKLDDDGPD